MILAVTGHRPQSIGGYTHAVTVSLLQAAVAALQHLQPTQVITGMALGWDQAIAEACHQQGIPFIAAVPFEGQAARWPSSSQAQYHRLLRKAAEIAVTCAEPGYAAWKMFRRNEWMVDKADRVLCLWNGKRSGGTWGCIQYAQKQGKPVSNSYKAYRHYLVNQQWQEHDNR